MTAEAAGRESRGFAVRGADRIGRAAPRLEFNAAVARTRAVVQGKGAIQSYRAQSRPSSGGWPRE